MMGDAASDPAWPVSIKPVGSAIRQRGGQAAARGTSGEACPWAVEVARARPRKACSTCFFVADSLVGAHARRGSGQGRRLRAFDAARRTLGRPRSMLAWWPRSSTSFSEPFQRGPHVRLPRPPQRRAGWLETWSPPTWIAPRRTSAKMRWRGMRSATAAARSFVTVVKGLWDTWEDGATPDGQGGWAIYQSIEGP